MFRVYLPWGQVYTCTTEIHTQPAVSFCMRVCKETQGKLICSSFCLGITVAYLCTLNSSHLVIFRLLWSLTGWQSKGVIVKGFMPTDRFNHWTAECESIARGVFTFLMSCAPLFLTDGVCYQKNIVLSWLCKLHFFAAHLSGSVTRNVYLGLYFFYSEIDNSSLCFYDIFGKWSHKCSWANTVSKP